MALASDPASYPFGYGARHQDMDALLAWGALAVTAQAVEVGTCPGVNSPIGGDAVIQVNAGDVPVEHVPNAIIGPLPLPLGPFVRLLGKFVTSPGCRIIGPRELPRTRIVGHFRQPALALLFAPAHP